MRIHRRLNRGYRSSSCIRRNARARVRRAPVMFNVVPGVSAQAHLEHVLRGGEVVGAAPGSEAVTVPNTRILDRRGTSCCWRCRSPRMECYCGTPCSILGAALGVGILGSLCRSRSSNDTCPSSRRATSSRVHRARAPYCMLGCTRPPFLRGGVDISGGSWGGAGMESTTSTRARPPLASSAVCKTSATRSNSRRRRRSPTGQNGLQRKVSFYRQTAVIEVSALTIHIPEQQPAFPWPRQSSPGSPHRL